jgi:hypothetical protein
MMCLIVLPHTQEKRFCCDYVTFPRRERKKIFSHCRARKQIALILVMKIHFRHVLGLCCFAYIRTHSITCSTIAKTIFISEEKNINPRELS